MSPCFYQISFYLNSAANGIFYFSVTQTDRQHSTESKNRMPKKKNRKTTKQNESQRPKVLKFIAQMHRSCHSNHTWFGMHKLCKKDLWIFKYSIIYMYFIHQTGILQIDCQWLLAANQNSFSQLAIGGFVCFWINKWLTCIRLHIYIRVCFFSTV